MKTKFIFILLCFLSLNVMGQGIITRESTRRTKPKTTQSTKTHRQEAQGKLKTKTASKPNPNNQNQNSGQRRYTTNVHEWVDLGLSVKWATCNVGANRPSDYGGYFAWGEINTKSRYEYTNCFDCLDRVGGGWATYKVGGLTQITPTSGHDTAHENWGGTWRMPTYDENEELCKKCKWTWTSKNGHNGYTVTGPNGNSIFLPAAGVRLHSRTYYIGSCGSYWSSTLISSSDDRPDIGGSCSLYFESSKYCAIDHEDRRVGRSVRPVTE